MSARQISFPRRDAPKHAADVASAAETCASRRQFVLSLGLKTAALTGALAACGKRGNLEPPPLEQATPSDAEEGDVQ